MKPEPVPGLSSGANDPESSRPPYPSIWQAMGQTHNSPRTKGEQFEALLTYLATPLVLLDRQFTCLWANDAYVATVNGDVSQTFGYDYSKSCPPAVRDALQGACQTKKAIKVPALPRESCDRPLWAATYWNWTAIPILDAGNEVDFLILTMADVTQPRLAELNTKATNELLRLFIKRPTRKAYLEAATRLLRDVTGCRHVGVRMRWPDDAIPYEAVVGFDSEFLQEEDRLQIGQADCLCTRIIAGRPLPEEVKSLTPTGSFYCNDTQRFVGGLSASARSAYRGLCPRKGYQSLAVIPIRHHGAILGAIHLADERPGVFALPLIEFLESVSPLIGEAVRRFDTEEALRVSGDKLRELNTTLERRADQLRAMASELTLTEQRERRRLAQVLHDHLQQLLVAAKIKVGILRRRGNAKAVDQSLAQIDDLLSESIRSSRSLTIDLSPPILFDAGLRPALEWLARQMREKYALHVDLDTGSTATPLGEDAQILVFQAVRELLFNVVQHAGVERARLQLEVARDRVKVIVEDSGVGFDLNEINTTGAAGDGLGLFSIRERLEVLGGHVRIDSQPGSGTRAEVSMPRQDVATEKPSGDEVACVQKGDSTASTSQPAQAARQKIRVLLADDHPILRQGLAGLLMEEPDLEVVGQAGNGLEAVEMAQRFRPDIVLMDVTMPELDGIEATARLSATLPQVRVIGLSMHEESGLAAAMREAGAVAYLSKGGSSDLLIATIRNAFASNGTTA